MYFLHVHIAILGCCSSSVLWSAATLAADQLCGGWHLCWNIFACQVNVLRATLDLPHSVPFSYCVLGDLIACCTHCIAQERELCATARLLPAQLLVLKAGLLRAGAASGGHLAREAAASLFRHEATHVLRVYDLLVAAGWLHAAPAMVEGQALGPGAGFDDASTEAAPIANGGPALMHAESVVAEAVPAPQAMQ